MLAVVVEEDTSRVVWPSCPAKGWVHGVNRLSGLPNGSPEGLVPRNDATSIEVHGPYQHGTGFPAVNGVTQMELFDSLTPATFKQADTGLQLPSVFTSETGAVTMSSFESMSPFLDSKHYGIHGGMAPDSCTNGGSGPGCVGRCRGRRCRCCAVVA